MLSENTQRVDNCNLQLASKYPNTSATGEVDDPLSLKENMASILNSDTDARTSSTTACMARSTLTSTVSGHSNPFALTQKNNPNTFSQQAMAVLEKDTELLKEAQVNEGDQSSTNE